MNGLGSANIGRFSESAKGTETIGPVWPPDRRAQSRPAPFANFSKKPKAI